MIVARGCALLLVSVVGLSGCKRDEPEEDPREGASVAPPVASAPLEPVTMGATDFCKLIYEAPLRQLEKSCSDAEKKSKTFAAISAKVQERTQSCWKMLNGGLQNKRLSLPSGTAKRCAEALDKLPWKTVLFGDITSASECRNLGVGLSVAGKPCRSGYECNPGLFCSGAREDMDGVCNKRGAAGDRCEKSPFALLGEGETSCESGLFCDHGGVLASLLPTPVPPPPRYGLGDPAPSESGPRPRVRAGSTNVSGRLPPEVIQRIVRANFGRFRLCYEVALRSDPTLSGRVTVKFVIGRDGSVSSVSGSGDIADQSVVSCVTRAFYGLTFPQPEGGIVTVSYPIIFAPSDAEADSGDAPDNTSLGAPTNTCMAYRKEGEECRAARECGGGLACVLGKCGKALKAGDTCQQKSDCEEPLLCVSKTAPADPEDGSAEDKPEARTCTAPQAEATCSSDEECPGACIDNKCQAFCGAG